MITVVTGLPGTGKTRLALALAQSMSDRDQSVLVLHTDVLKVTLRTAGVEGLAGPIQEGDLPTKLRVIRPYLDAQADKANRDGYELVIEGTLALGFGPANTVILSLDEGERAARVARKHPTATQTLTDADLSEYSACLQTDAPLDALRLDAAQPVHVLVRAIAGHSFPPPGGANIE